MMKNNPSIRDVPLRPPAGNLTTTIAWGFLFVLLMWSWRGADMRPLDLIKYSGNMSVFLQEFFPPNFHDWRVYLEEMVVTVHIAVWARFLATLSAIPSEVP